MNKKNKMFLIALVLSGTLTFSSCGKYEDGPGFSLRSKTARLTNGKWELKELDGESIDNGELTIEFDKDGEFTIKSTYSYYGGSSTYTADGEWEWGDGKESVELDFDDGFNDEWEIKRLTNDELWVEDEDNFSYEFDKD